MMAGEQTGKNIVIMAGGTGGHVFPAIAVAQELQERGYTIAWLGTRRGLEASVVPEKGFPIHFINAVGVRGKSLVEIIKAPFVIAQGLLQALGVMLKLKPVSVLGMGGFVTVPGGVACWLLRKPLVLHEQNAYAGTANRFLSRFAQRLLQGFSGAFANGERLGNPVRQEIAVLSEETVGDIAQQQTLNLLVLGGSLGAQAINEALPGALNKLAEDIRPCVLHQTGKTTYEKTLQVYEQQGLAIDGETISVKPFIDDMSVAYQWADLVLCRAGAITTAEIACAGLPAVFVPFPYATDDHQTKNAEYFVEHNAALLLPQSKLDENSLSKQLSDLLNDRSRLSAMAKQARGLAEPQAAQKVADVCEQVAGRGAFSGGNNG